MKLTVRLRPSQKGDFIFQPWIFSCSVSFRECIELEHWALGDFMLASPLSRFLRNRPDLGTSQTKELQKCQQSDLLKWPPQFTSDTGRLDVWKNTTWKDDMKSPRVILSFFKQTNATWDPKIITSWNKFRCQKGVAGSYPPFTFIQPSGFHMTKGWKKNNIYIYIWVKLKGLLGPFWHNSCPT